MDLTSGLSEYTLFKPRDLGKHQEYNDLVNIFLNGYSIESHIKPIIGMWDKNLYIYFPTPCKYISESVKSDIASFTQNAIKENLKNNPEKVIIDLRHNLGGEINVFYDSLIGVLPDYKNKTLVCGHNDKFGDVAKITHEEDTFNIYLKKPNKEMKKVFTRKLQNEKIWFGKTELWIDEKSMSSSQLIAVMMIQEYGRESVRGSSSAPYTNGSLPIDLDDILAVIPYYYFKDKNNIIYKNI